MWCKNARVVAATPHCQADVLAFSRIISGNVSFRGPLPTAAHRKEPHVDRTKAAPLLRSTKDFFHTHREQQSQLTSPLSSPVRVAREAEVPLSVLSGVAAAADVSAHHADPEVVRDLAGLAVKLGRLRGGGHRTWKRLSWFLRAKGGRTDPPTHVEPKVTQFHPSKAIKTKQKLLRRL